MEKILITGGGGFIGGVLLNRVLNLGGSVNVVDKKCQHANVAHANLHWFQGDILDADILEAAMDGCDAVIHLAAQVSVAHSIRYPEETYTTNVQGTAQVLSTAKKLGDIRVIVASSAAVYGTNQKMPLHEEGGVEPLSPYAESKRKNELQVLEARRDGMETVALRFFNVYGPTQSSTSAYAAVVPAFVDRMMRRERPQIFGDGRQTRDFVHVSDLADVLLLMATTSWKDVRHPVYNVASEQEISLLDLIDEINASLKKQTNVSQKLTPVFLPAREGDIYRSVASISRLRDDFCWEPKIKFCKGIDEMVMSKLSSR